MQAREPTLDLAALESGKCCFQKRYGIFYRASGFPQETSPAAEAATTSCSDAISSSAKVGDGESGRDNIYYNHLYTYNWNP